MSREDNKKFLLNVAAFLAGASDLKVAKTKCSKLKSGKVGKFKAKVQNLEQCYSNPTELAFYFSEDQKFNSVGPAKDKDILIGRMTIPQIPGNGSKWLKLKANVKVDIGSDYYVLAVINPDGDAIEANSDNNVGSKMVTIN